MELYFVFRFLRYGMIQQIVYFSPDFCYLLRPASGRIKHKKIKNILSFFAAKHFLSGLKSTRAFMHRNWFVQKERLKITQKCYSLQIFQNLFLKKFVATCRKYQLNLACPPLKSTQKETGLVFKKLLGANNLPNFQKRRQKCRD